MSIDARHIETLTAWLRDDTPETTPAYEIGFEAGWFGEPMPEERDKRRRRPLQRGWQDGRDGRAEFLRIQALKIAGLA